MATYKRWVCDVCELSSEEVREGSGRGAPGWFYFVGPDRRPQDDAIACSRECAVEHTAKHLGTIGWNQMPLAAIDEADNGE